eukprot:scaffold151671_cov37-Tisochrysis_lutea.AAC.3
MALLKARLALSAELQPHSSQCHRPSANCEPPCAERTNGSLTPGPAARFDTAQHSGNFPRLYTSIGATALRAGNKQEIPRINGATDDKMR